jgi:hypothetical protein
LASVSLTWIKKIGVWPERCASPRPDPFGPLSKLQNRVV